MIEIVQAQLRHIPAILEIERTSFEPAWSKDALINETGRDDVFFGIAVEDDKALGFCILRLISGEAELFQIAAAGGYRRSGIGSRLLDGALAFCAQNGVAAVYLEVRESNEAAVRFYEKHGFSCSGVRKKYYTNPVENAVIMVLNMPVGY